MAGPAGNDDPTQDAQAAAEIDDVLENDGDGDWFTSGSVLDDAGDFATRNRDDPDQYRYIGSVSNDELASFYEDNPEAVDEYVVRPDADGGLSWSDGEAPTWGDAVGQFEEDVSNAVDTARNLGPDWLDELTLVAIALGVIGALLYLGRPFAMVAANATE